MAFDFMSQSYAVIEAAGWDAGGFMMKSPSVVGSLVNANGIGGASSINMITTDSGAGLFSNAFYNDMMLGLLSQYHLTQAILDVLYSTMADIIGVDAPTITLRGASKKHNEEVNKFIAEIGLTSNIVQNLKEDMYWGQRAFYVSEKVNRVVELKYPRAYVSCHFLGRPSRYIFTPSAQVTSTNIDLSKDEKRIYVDYNKYASISFNETLIGNRRSTSKDSSGEPFQFSKVPEIDSMLVDLTYYKGNSVLKGCLWLLFIHFLIETVLNMLIVKDTTRPALLAASMAENGVPERGITEAVNMIESFLNQGEYGTINFMTSSPMTILQSIFGLMANSVKVVPGMKNFCDIKNLDLPDLSGKIKALQEMLDGIRKQIMNNIGIPDEIFGNESNRWEIVSKSSRFQSLISSLIKRVTLTYRIVISNYIKNKYSEDVRYDDIIVPLDKNNFLVSSTFASKIGLIQDNVDKLSQSLATIVELAGTKCVKTQEMFKYLKGKLAAADPDLADLVKIPEGKVLDEIMGIEVEAPMAGGGGGFEQPFGDEPMPEGGAGGFEEVVHEQPMQGAPAEPMVAEGNAGSSEIFV